LSVYVVNSQNGLILITDISLSVKLFQSCSVFEWADNKGALTPDDHPWISCFSGLEFLWSAQVRELRAALKQHAVFTDDHRGKCQWGWRAAVRTEVCATDTHTYTITGPVLLWLWACDPPLHFTDAEGWSDRSQPRNVSREV